MFVCCSDNYYGGGGGGGDWSRQNRRGYRDDRGYGGGGGGRAPKIPDEPPFTAFVGGLPDGTVQGDLDRIFENLNVSTNSSFSLLHSLVTRTNLKLKYSPILPGFVHLFQIKNVRIVRDRETDKFKGIYFYTALKNFSEEI